ncbi:MAG: hypothetical protein JNJ53_13045 [Rhizobiales bacterium]|nr:hypothetical protein [Hyphomicrobiales bacterium]
MRGASVLAIAAAFLATATAALATETTICSGDGASISMLMGATPVVSIAKVDMEAGTKRWSTQKEDGVTPISVGQAFETSEILHVDITDDNVSEILAKLRIYKASEGDFYAAGGTLWISGVGAWAVNCSGP